jgi:hypothetical protein
MTIDQQEEMVGYFHLLKHIKTMISESYFYSHDVPIKVYFFHLPLDDSSVVSSSFSLALNSSPD